MTNILVQGADIAWQVKCRQEDMQQRAIDNERRSIDDARRSVDEKAEMLRAVSHLSALIAGFAMVVMVEIALPDQINFVLLVLYGATSASVVGLMLLAMLNCTMMLIAILKYDCVNRPIPYEQFWQTRCEGDWRFAYQCFSLGVPMFMVVLAQIGWIVFAKYSKNAQHTDYRSYVPAAIVTLVAVACLFLWYVHVKAKWGGFNVDGAAKLVDPLGNARPDAGLEPLAAVARHDAAAFAEAGARPPPPAFEPPGGGL